MLKPILKFWFILICWPGQWLFSQSIEEPEMNSGYYVIVGTFAIRDNALHFYNELSREGYKPGLTKQFFYHIYLHYDSSKDKAIDHAISLREKFVDVWVKGIGVNVENKISKTSGEIPQPVINLTNSKFRKVQIVLREASSSKEIEGRIHVEAFSDTHFLKTMPANACDTLPPDVDKVILSSDRIGYEKVQRAVDMNSFSKEGFPSDSCLKIELELSRIKLNQTKILEHISFYKNSVIMSPESRDDLNELIQLLTLNGNMKIRLHGHTNGNHRGKILYTKSKNNFFNPADSAVTFGSAKSLAFRRANVIKQFLVANKISSSRIEVKAWGGKRALYEEDGENAHKNMRVEMEILKD